MSFTERMAAQLRRPSSGITGWIVKRLLRSNNTYLELNAVRLCNLDKDHFVLEAGFGLGIGVKRAAQAVQSGSGKVYGIDFSPEMMREASQLLEDEVAAGKVQLTLGDVAHVPYRDNTMDRIFHCNCYYFWPDIEHVCKELLRVLKPGAFMVTGLNLASLRVADSRNVVTFDMWNPERYMDALRQVGFTEVEMKEEVCEESKQTFEAIFAYKPSTLEVTVE